VTSFTKLLLIPLKWKVQYSGALMLERSAFETVSSIISDESFYDDRHRTIFHAVQHLAQKSQPIHTLSVIEELKHKGELENVGGAYYVTHLTDYHTGQVEHSCRYIQERFLQRKVIEVCGEMISHAYSPGVDVFELLDQAEENILAIRRDNIQFDGISMDRGLVDAIKQIESNRHKPEGMTGVPTGFKTLDRITRGWQPGDLIYVGARPSVGKTAFAIKVAKIAAMNKIPVAFKSLEMKVVRLILRMLAEESKIILHKLQTGNMDDSDMKNLYKNGIQQLAKLDIIFDEKPGRSLLEFKSWIRRMVNKRHVGLVVVDYLQLLSGKGNEQSREREIATISRELKLLALELSIPIIALSQLSREIEKRNDPQPKLSDLRESGSIEQDADLVIFLWNPVEDGEKNTEGTSRKLRVAKQRDGMLLTIDLEFKTETQQINELTGMPLQGKLPMSGNWKPVEGAVDWNEPDKKEIPAQ
jgi:replicative DNA helicase